VKGPAAVEEKVTKFLRTATSGGVKRGGGLRGSQTFFSIHSRERRKKGDSTGKEGGGGDPSKVPKKLFLRRKGCVLSKPSKGGDHYKK